MQFQRALNKQNAPKPEPKLKSVKPAGGLGQVQANEAISKAAESAGMNAPVTANKPLTDMQDFHTSLMDKVRENATNAKKQMDAFDYKYDKGQRVFTEDSAKKNRPPYEIIERHRHGNQLMWEGEPWTSKKIIDPETGRAMRTPYEPGYRVRGEIGEMILPESAIKGNVDMARGGLTRMAEGGESIDKSLKRMQNYSVGDQGAKKPNELSGVVLAGASWMAGDEKTKLAKQAFGEDVTNTAIGGQKTSDVLNQLNVFKRDGGTFAPNTTVVLDIGANDIAQGVDEATIRANLNEIVSRLGDEGVQVILSGQPEAHSYEEAINRTDLQMDDLYQDIAANNPNVVLVDAMSDFLNQKDLMDESRFHLSSDESKLAYLNKFADAYKSMDTGNEEAAGTPEQVQLQQVADPMKQDFQAAISQTEDPVVDQRVTDPIKQEFQEIITQDPAREVVQERPDTEPSAGYTYAQNNSGIDNYYQVINDYLAQERTQDEIQAAMEQYGVSQADIDAARDYQPSGGRLDESYATAQYKRGGKVLHMADAGKVTKGVVGALTKATEMAKAEKAVPKVDRLSMSYKDVTKRVPEVADALEQLLKGDITKAQYNDIVNTYKPVTPYSFVPKPATKDEAVGALRGDAAKERYGKQAEYTPGSKIGLRLDIPAYTGKGVWVNSIHDEKAKKVAYGPVASVKNADLGISQAESKRIAQGGSKAPYARIKGEWNPISEEEAIAKAQEYLDHPEWRQIGMDPERHSYFYDRRTMQPITNAEEIIQIGPLVLGKNPKYANIDDFDYATGGKVRHMADAGRVTKGVTGALTKAKEMAKAKKAGESKIAEMLAAQQAPMTTPSGTGLPLMPRDQGMYTPREQKDLPRMPTVDKARAANKSPKYNERMQDLLDSPTARKKVDSLINKGKDLNMKEWYGTEPLRQVAMDAGRTPEQFESLMAQLASASQRNPVDKQNQMGSYLYHLSETGQLPENSLLLTNKLKKALKEDPSLAEGRQLVELPTGYGSLAQGDIFNRAVMIGQGKIGEALPPNKKLGTFYENLLGNLQPVTVDVNAVRGPIIERGDPRWLTSKLVEKDETGKVINSYKPREMLESGEMTLREAKQRPGFWEAAPSGSEYAGFEELWQRGAKRHNVAPAEAQALGWYGSADVTALKTKPENYVDNLERLIKRTAEQTGKSPTEVMNDMVTGKGFLRKEGGAVKREESPEDMARFQKRFAMHKAIGGHVKKMAGGGKASIFDAPKMASGGRASIFDTPAKRMSKGGSSDEPTAKEIAEQLGKLAVEQGKEEYQSFKKPRAATDIGNRGILAPALGLPVDMMNMGLSGVDALTGLMGKPTRLSSEKPFAGSEHIKDLMDRYGVTSGEDRPMTETMLSLFSPTGMIKGAQSATKGALKAADAMRKPRAGAMREKTN
jgi:hypothetical protein